MVMGRSIEFNEERERERKVERLNFERCNLSSLSSFFNINIIVYDLFLELLWRKI